MDNSNEFGKYLKALRVANGFKLVSLSELSGVSHPYLSQIENGRLKNVPSPDVLRAISTALNCTHIGMMIKAGHITEQEVFGFIDQEKVRFPSEKYC